MDIESLFNKEQIEELEDNFKRIADSIYFNKKYPVAIAKKSAINVMDFMINNNQIKYMPEARNWVRAKVLETASIAYTALNIKHFYDEEVKDEDEGIKLLFESEEFPQLNILSREGKNMLVHKVSWDLVTVKMEGKSGGAFSGKIKDFRFETKEKAVFDRNEYRSLAKKVHSKDHVYGLLLMNSPNEIQDDYKQYILETKYITHFMRNSLLELKK